MSELRIKPDKNALEELVNKAEGMSLEGVDAQVAAEFKTAVMSATAVLNDEQATQQEVDTAKANLQASIDKVSVSVDNSQSERTKKKKEQQETHPQIMYIPLPVQMHQHKQKDSKKRKDRG